MGSLFSASYFFANDSDLNLYLTVNFDKKKYRSIFAVKHDKKVPKGNRRAVDLKKNVYFYRVRTTIFVY